MRKLWVRNWRKTSVLRHPMRPRHVHTQLKETFHTLKKKHFTLTRSPTSASSTAPKQKKAILTGIDNTHHRRKKKSIDSIPQYK